MEKHPISGTQWYAIQCIANAPRIIELRVLRVCAMNMAMGWIAFHRVPLQPKNEKSMKPPVKFSPESVTAICDTRKHTARLLFTVAKRRYRNLQALMEVSCQS